MWSRTILVFLDAPKSARIAVGVLLLCHTFLLAYSGYVHSPTGNEPGHLVAGLSHWEFGEFELYRVNPPLVRMMAALPVIAHGYEADWSSFFEGPGARPEFAMGEDFVDANGPRSFYLFMIARWACIPFSWIGGLVCYLWARDLYGRASGVMACGLWCFEPTILGQASLITPDAHAAALGLVACYTFWRWLKRPTWLQTVTSGIVLGVAELAKTTLIILYPLWPVLWLIDRWPVRQSMHWQDWCREGAMLVVRLVIGLYVLNLGYGFEGSGHALGRFSFVSNLFAGSAVSSTASHADSESAHDAVRRPGNRFAGSWLGALPVPLPKNYLLGIDVQQSDFEHYGRPSYLGGEWRDTGWWYFYLYAVAVKVPLALWLMGLLAVGARQLKLLERPSVRDELALLLPPFVIFLVVGSKTGFSEHMRYVLPAFPFAFVWISQLATATVKRSVSWLAPLVLVLCGWFVVGSLYVYPHSLAYFNELAGGPRGGPKHLLSSNLDWGQDLRYLQWWMQQNPDARPLRLAYSGRADPAALGVHSSGFPLLASGPGDTKQLPPGWYALSINRVMGAPGWTYDGAGRVRFARHGEFAGYQVLTPESVVGASIYIYRIRDDR